MQSVIEIWWTDVYVAWYEGLNSTVRFRVQNKVDHLAQGNFGDHKSVGDNVWEIRCDFAGGIRIYYTMRGRKAVLLLAGGNKSTQDRDIAKAKAMLDDIRSADEDN